MKNMKWKFYKLDKIILIVLIGIALFDAASTYYSVCVAQDAFELNSTATFFIYSFGYIPGLIFVKSVGVGGIFLLWGLFRNYKTAARYIPFAFFILLLFIEAIPVPNNLLVLLGVDSQNYIPTPVIAASVSDPSLADNFNTRSDTISAEFRQADFCRLF